MKRKTLQQLSDFLGCPVAINKMWRPGRRGSVAIFLPLEETPSHLLPKIAPNGCGKWSGYIIDTISSDFIEYHGDWKKSLHVPQEDK